MNHCKREQETKRMKLPVPQYISSNMLHFYESVIPSGSLYSVWRVSQEMRKAPSRLSKKQGTLLSNFSEIHCVRQSAHSSRIEHHFCLKFTMCISSPFLKFQELPENQDLQEIFCWYLIFWPSRMRLWKRKDGGVESWVLILIHCHFCINLNKLHGILKTQVQGQCGQFWLGRWGQPFWSHLSGAYPD